MLGNEVRILDPDVEGHFDTFQLLFMTSAQRTLLPELLEIFGEEALMKFLDIFGGVTFKVPDRSLLERAVRDTDIYETVRKSDAPEVVEHLSRKYSLPQEYVREIWRRVKDLRQKAGLPV